MRIIQFICRVNLTTTGTQFGSTNQTYFNVPADVDGKVIFGDKDIILTFINKKNKNETVDVRYKEYDSNGQCRIIINQFFRKKNICPGDEVILEKRNIGEESEFYIDYNQFGDDSVFLQKVNGKGLIDMKKNINLINDKVYEDNLVSVLFLERSFKNKNSSVETEFFDLKVEDKSLMDITNLFKHNEITKVTIYDDKISIRLVNKFIFNEFEVEL